MSVAVREARAGEVPAVISMYEWLFAPPGVDPPAWGKDLAADRLSRAIAELTSAVFVAEENGDLVGLCTAYLDIESVRYGQRCWVEDLVVGPEGRSRGTGKALLDAAKAWAAERGATHLELDSGDQRTDAHRFYEREEPSWTSRQFSWQL